MKKNMTMISRLLAFSFLVLMGVTQAMAYERTLPQTSTDANPVYYLIMDLERGFYLRFTGAGEAVIDDQCSQLTDNHLWYFVASGNGYKIAPKQLNGQYLLNSGTYNSNYNATGDTWLIQAHTSGDGYMVYTSKTGGYYSDYWRIDRYFTSDHARVGRESGAIPSRAGKFIFIPYEEVVDKAQSIQGKYVIKSVSTDKYVCQDYFGNITLEDNTNSSNSVWQVTNTGANTATLTGGLHGHVQMQIKAVRDINLMPSHDAVNDNHFILGGGEQHTLDASNPNEKYKINADWDHGLTTANDWMFIPYEESMTVYHNPEDFEIGRFFRFENCAVTHAIGSSSATSGQGYLEDVDHRVDNVALDADGNRVDMYVVNKDMSHAAALWEVEVLAWAGDMGDHATGTIPHQHNLSIIRNVNTNKYIGKYNELALGGGSRNGGSYLPITPIDPEKSLNLFKRQNCSALWFESLGNGQYCIAIYSTMTGGQDQAMGYLVADATTAGLKWQANKPAAGSAGAWYIHEAKTIDVNMNGVRLKDGSYSETAWASAYFPFAVAPQEDSDVKVYTGEWKDQDDQYSILLNEASEVPANQGIIVTKGYSANEMTSTLVIISSVSQAEANKFASSPFLGIVESENYPIKQGAARDYVDIVTANSDEYKAGYSGDSTFVEAGWGWYYVLSANPADNNPNVGMYHPNGNYLIANKAFLSVESIHSDMPQSRVLFMIKPHDIDPFNAVEEIMVEQEQQPAVIYDIMGRRVVNPTRGIYIVNGKKVFIQ